MAKRRLERLNSLLREVLSDVIRTEVKDPHLPSLVTITFVEITSDLRQAKVHTSVIGDQTQRQLAIKVLNRAAGFIAERAAKQVVVRYFPSLRFVLDDSIDDQMHIEGKIQEIKAEEGRRPTSS